MIEIDDNNNVWSLFCKAQLGGNVREIVETEECKILRVDDESGEGTMTMYCVFDGVYLMYNDFHMKHCYSGFSCEDIMMCIAMLGYIPIMMPLLAVFCPLVGGIPMMLFYTKTKKFGMITIMSVIIGIYLWVTGMGIYPAIFGVVFGFLADLVAKSGQNIFELSGGEKQKIACGSVSALQPEIMVLDEPTSS